METAATRMIPGTDNRYSLVQMQREIGLDRNHSAFSRELLNRAEIDKIFAERRTRRPLRRR